LRYRPSSQLLIACPVDPEALYWVHVRYLRRLALGFYHWRSFRQASPRIGEVPTPFASTEDDVGRAIGTCKTWQLLHCVDQQIQHRESDAGGSAHSQTLTVFVKMGRSGRSRRGSAGQRCAPGWASPCNKEKNEFPPSKNIVPWYIKYCPPSGLWVYILGIY